MRLSKLAVVLSVVSSIHWGAAEARVFRCIDSDGIPPTSSPIRCVG